MSTHERLERLPTRYNLREFVRNEASVWVWRYVNSFVVNDVTLRVADTHGPVFNHLLSHNL